MFRDAVPVCSAAEAAALDRAAIEGGMPGRALMGRAGAAAAAEIARAFPHELARGTLVLAGSGNNGGDGWVVARALHAAGHRVRVWESAPARSADAAAERRLAVEAGVPVTPALISAGEGLVVDALLGTGAALPVRRDLVPAIRFANEAGGRGACVVAIDLPTGLDATSGALDDAGHVVRAQRTITFGTVKRGHLVARGSCGDVVIVDIGLPVPHDAALPRLVDTAQARQLLPASRADAHKGTKKRVAIIGGAPGMAGAAVLAGRGALRAGAGLVKLVVHPASLAAVQQAEPQALAAAWPEPGEAIDAIARWADVLAIGPGLGADAESRRLVERVLDATDMPVVLDADGLNVFAGDLVALRDRLRARPALLTPHPAEMMRLAGVPDVDTVLARRFEIGGECARAVEGAVLLKGTPTIVSGPDGARLVTATGTPALATGGSGDVLTGVAATLLAQIGDPTRAGALAAWVHGRAAELATIRTGTDRGVPLATITEALPDALTAAWSDVPPHTRYPVLAELPLPTRLAMREEDA